ncbi:hypothetical protein [Haloplanus sp.]|uniref:hypothetical protein n=1 Tax=Haloplanus sp. TaxID=1961696 RepID=UPI0026363DDD|nr:hypothetical protein [Haloplanus sp.]
MTALSLEHIQSVTGAVHDVFLSRADGGDTIMKPHTPVGGENPGRSIRRRFPVNSRSAVSAWTVTPHTSGGGGVVCPSEL